MTHACSLESARSPRALLLLMVAALWLTLAPDAEAKDLRPAVKLGPIVVLNGAATVTGTVRGVAPNEVLVTIDGRPVGLNLDGTFFAVVYVGGRSALVVEVLHLLSRERSTVSIPLDSSPLGGVLPDVLAAIERAAVSILQPPGGFTIVDGRPLVLQGSIGSGDQLVRVEVNGVDVLRLLDDLGRFAVPIPGTSKTITIVIVDNRGTEATTTIPVAQQTSAPPPPAAPVTRKAQAVGLRVASVRYVTKNFRRTKRVQMIVTVKDSLGRAVRGARVQVRAASGKSLRLKPKLKRTGARGRVSFLLHPRARLFGNRLRIITTATTPAARAKRTTSVRVPRAPVRTLTRRR